MRREFRVLSLRLNFIIELYFGGEESHMAHQVMELVEEGTRPRVRLLDRVNPDLKEGARVTGAQERVKGKVRSSCLIHE